ncbi:2-nitropropane dioxygenase [Mycena chlorophos]|uniref:2-nitropropane dioxygenase n=1 Tax=Mycena chlorophos TaxID=658473 RepID=A0A8H6RXY9_MYCCL|nr:2-nitropropane dioxygenase [Mycena chlorophos]
MALTQLPLDETLLIATWLEALIYGCLFVIFVATVYINLTVASNNPHNRVMFGVSVVLFVIATMHLAMNLYRLIRGFVVFRDAPGGPAAYLGVLEYWDHIFSGTHFMQPKAYSATLQRNWRIVVLPFLLLLGSTVSGYMVCGLYTTVDPSATVFSPRLAYWITTFYSIPVVQNIMTTTHGLPPLERRRPINSPPQGCVHLESGAKNAHYQHSAYKTPRLVFSQAPSTAHPLTSPATLHVGLKTPIISAPMGFAATPEMAAAVTNGGGFGTYGATFDSTAVIKEKMAAIRRLLGITHDTPGPIAIGFIGLILDMTEVSDDPRLAAALGELPVAIWLSFGDFGKYIKQIREHDKETGRTTFIFAPVGCLEDALRYAPEVDCLAVQATHGSRRTRPPLLVAAGGITTGAQIAGLLTMGASGVVLGTRFLFTPECEYGPAAKEALLAAGLQGTVRTLAYDDVGRTNGWPPNYNGRALRNAVMDDVEAGLSLDERLAKFDASKAAGDVSRIVVWAGVGVGLVNDIRPTADVLKELHEEAFKHLHASANMLVL